MTNDQWTPADEKRALELCEDKARQLPWIVSYLLPRAVAEIKRLTQELKDEY